LVNRQSFIRFELVLFNGRTCDDLLFSLESNKHLRIKLKTFEQRCMMYSEDLREWKEIISLMISLRNMRLTITRWLDFKDDIIRWVNRSSLNRLELIIINDSKLEKSILSLSTALRGLRISIENWLDSKNVIIELVNRPSFKRLELIHTRNENCDDLLFTIESNASLRLKLKALVLRYNIHRPAHYEDWKVKAKNPYLLRSNEFFFRLLNVTQGLEEFRFDIVRELTPIGLGKHYNKRTKNEEYPAFFNNFNPKKMNILSYICNVRCQYTLKPILQKCGSTLKHLKISNWGAWNLIEYPVDEILSLCPNLLSLHADYLGLKIGKTSQEDESSDPASSSSQRVKISPIHPLQYIQSYGELSALVESWLKIHCPNLSKKPFCNFNCKHNYSNHD